MRHFLVYGSVLVLLAAMSFWYSIIVFLNLDSIIGNEIIVVFFRANQVAFIFETKIAIHGAVFFLLVELDEGWYVLHGCTV